MRLAHWLYIIPLRLRSIFRRQQVEQELDEEIRYHIERRIEHEIAKGASPQEARNVALRAMNGLEQRKEECRDMRRVSFFENLMQDFRYALRMLGKSLGFTAIAVTSLALGIGANTAIFSLVNAVLLRTLPVSHPEQLVLLTSFQRDRRVGSFAYPDYQRLRDRSQVFSSLLAASPVGRIDVGWGAELQQAQGEIVSGNYFSALGVRAVLGRVLT